MFKTKMNKDGSWPGMEMPDPTPIKVAIGPKRVPSMSEQVKILMGAAQREAQRQGMETFEESEDFDIPDDPIDPTTPYEQHFARSTQLLKEYRDAQAKLKERKAVSGFRSKVKDFVDRFKGSSSKADGVDRSERVRDDKGIEEGVKVDLEGG